jgi:tRNA G18 (ribose-2'-O)-methylase SpoU
MTRGYFGIGIVAGKSPENVGGLWRSAHALGAAFIFTVGHRYPKQPTDTTKAWRHIPLMEFDSPGAFMDAQPKDCRIVAVECGKGRPKPLVNFNHPERAIYMLGAEDSGLPDDALEAADHLVVIPGDYCLNVATAGSILMYDRIAKAAA